LTGDAAANQLEGGTGTDTLNGGDGDDLLIVERGRYDGRRRRQDRVLLTNIAEADVITLGPALMSWSSPRSLAGAQGRPWSPILSRETPATGSNLSLLAAAHDGRAGDEPFATGHLRLLQDGAATVLQLDPGRRRRRLFTLLTLQKHPLCLHTANFGFDPGRFVFGTEAGDFLVGGSGPDEIRVAAAMTWSSARRAPTCSWAGTATTS
jgi:Ca2+-binding RTX toxin-like protein